MTNVLDLGRWVRSESEEDIVEGWKERAGEASSEESKLSTRTHRCMGFIDKQKPEKTARKV
jgi:hypothetical protein